MIKMSLTPSMSVRSAEQALAIGYAPADAVAALHALMALDATLGTIIRSTREPIVGQMRLTWWHEALTRLDVAPAPAEPVLQALAAAVLPVVGGAALAGLIDGWEALLEPILDDVAIEQFATARGARLFAFAGTLCGIADPRLTTAGEGWALADLSLRTSDRAIARMIAQRASVRLDNALAGRWPRRARALGALALLARSDLRDTMPAVGGPKRIGRILIHRLTGR